MINVDAAYDGIKGPASSGAVIRDSTGGFIAASHNYIPHTIDAATAEAYALRDGLLLAQQIGCTRVEFQSDCTEVVNTMQCRMEVSRPWLQWQSTMRMRSSNIGRNLVRYLLVIVIDLVIQ